ncbi:hypothetical protein [Desulfitobacterium sp. PCE1]|uniref:hypothetical protein n=1 Tax=Desulfitobacterium sp. PCE1 TaxID=146907 RepID=UPI000376AB0E|nr:hypothetical protein [Desulfitobacterium sp. PCE1]
MRKMYLLIGSVALGVGLVIGIVGYALATTPTDGNSRLTFWNKENGLYTSELGEGAPQTGMDVLYPHSPEEEALDPTEAGSEEVTIPSTASNNVSEDLAQEILADYKLNVAALFEAWKSPDMVAFRKQLEEAYTGELFEKHARQAESFIVQGVGMEVSSILFEEVKVDTATMTSATLTATYNYVAHDYDIGNQMAIGESTKHQVKVRVNMVKKDTRWLITGETVLES